MSSSITLTGDLQRRIHEYKDDIKSLNQQIDTLTETHDLTTALRYIPMALKDASYTSKIFDEQTRALVDSLRLQEDLMQRINRESDKFSMKALRNNIQIAEMQLDADKHRGRMTRNQREQVEKLQLANQRLSIEEMRNQLEVMQVKQNGYNQEKEQLERIKLSYQDRLFTAKDSYQDELQSLRGLIRNKQSLIEQHTQSLKSEYDERLLLYDQYLKDMRALDKGTQQKIIKETGGIPLEGMQEIHETGSSTPSIRSKIFDDFERSVLGKRGFDVGTRFVPETGLYTLHRGEAVIPSRENTTRKHSSVDVNVKLDGGVSIDVTRASTDDLTWISEKVSKAVRAGLMSGVDTVYD
jgi:hypothetical protein